MEENNINNNVVNQNTNTLNEQPIINPVVEQVPVVEPTQNPEQESIIEPVQEQQIIEQPKESEIKTSGTATEEELYIDAVKPDAEIIDEYEIKNNVLSEKKRYKRNTIFIVIVALLIVAFIVLLPFITKWIGY